tara:strand:- start:91 stop:1071 length:981 start_codon:yes stop_codon:yes gene_type:complete
LYYNRTLTKEFSQLIEKGGHLRWLFNFVKKNDDLDFLIGRNNNNEWVSIYRGLSRILTIHPRKRNNMILKIDADKAYKSIKNDIYGIKSLPLFFEKELKSLISGITKNKKFDGDYKNEKEGYYQNELSRLFGICGNSTSDFVIIDKEVVIGYQNKTEKQKICVVKSKKYKKLLNSLSKYNSKRFGKNLQNKSVGNELDFLALDKKGNILLIEYKHGTNTSGIYLSPFQIGMYYDLFKKLPMNDLQNAVFEMLSQKKKIGLINSDWVTPKTIKKIIPVLIISNYNYKSSAKVKYREVLKFLRASKGNNFLKNIKTLNYTSSAGLTPW